MVQPYTPGEEDFDADEIIRRATARRGDIFPEFQIFIRSIPKAYALNQRCAGYVHQYAELGTKDQVLSLPMRELIATTQLCAKGDDRFAPNHVRRMWRLGVTNRVMFEAALAMAMAAGWSTIGHVALAVLTAGDPSYTDGAVPEGGEPKTLKPFPELTQGRVRIHDCDERLTDDPDWKDIAQIDPELVARFSKLADYAQLVDGAGSEDLLGPGPRALITIAGLCARGFTELAARHIRRAYAYAMTRKQVFEAISCLLPMGGGPALQIGMQAMRLADAR